MASTKESYIYTLIKRHCDGIFFKRVENTVLTGTPDAYFAYGGTHGIWMEAKYMNIGKRPRTLKVPFQPLQYEWLRSHYKAGGHSLLAIWSDKGLFFAEDEEIQREYSFDEFSKALNGELSILQHVEAEDLKEYLKTITNAQ